MIVLFKYIFSIKILLTELIFFLQRGRVERLLEDTQGLLTNRVHWCTAFPRLLRIWKIFSFWIEIWRTFRIMVCNSQRNTFTYIETNEWVKYCELFNSSLKSLFWIISMISWIWKFICLKYISSVTKVIKNIILCWFCVSFQIGDEFIPYVMWRDN